MGNIVILDENTSNKIAAGEVIERPASLVKELVENSIDAGANIISVEIRNGGISYIKITDNGCGIAEDDAVIAFERHATSKIRNSNDLDSINTLGFRGEALASIAAVASVELTSRVVNNTNGTYVKIQGGNVLEVKKTGCPVGTTFIIRELFYNTPARFKFLKKDSTEAGYISDVIERIALGNPHISIRLTANGSTVLHTPGNGDLLSVIYSIYGKETAKSCIEVSYEDEKVKIYGYAGKQEIARNNRNYQSLFVNTRYIKSKLISSAIDEAYKTILMKNKFPFIVLFTEINPMLVDVNVHPTKMEVRFSDEQGIFRSIYHAVNNALITGQDFREVVTPEVKKEDFKMPENKYIKPVEYAQQSLENSKLQVAETAAAFETKKSSVISKPDIKKYSQPEGNNSLREYLKESEKTDVKPAVQAVKEIVPQKVTTADNKVAEQAVYKTVEEKDKSVSDLTSARIVGQVFSTYIILQSGEEMLLIDQHAAHERITYEMLKEKYEKNESLAQYLLNPEVIELTYQEFKLVQDEKETLSKLGFTYEEFGSNSIILRSVPANDSGLIKEIFHKVLDEIFSRSNHEISEKVDDVLYSIACKASVKANRKLDDAEVTSLVNQLSSLRNPFTCPHGRPTVLKLSKYELEKMFKRIV